MLQSIAFIPDGNRRYAFANNLSLAEAYLMGTRKAWNTVEWLASYPSVKFISFYTLSMENLSRSREELSVLFRIFSHEIDRARKESTVNENPVRIRFVGRKDYFPKDLQEKMNLLETETAHNSEKTISLLIGYNGQQEIVDAAKKAAEQIRLGQLSPEQLTPESFKNYLYADFMEPDLLVRSSGTQRLSGFLSYQSAYSELYFLDKYWPEVSKTDIDQAIEEFESRKRRFGK
ncbi:MAG: di-trans,poly-cis-decaprenylcistransferase [Candidatus Diapherotrites archaeon]|nr:di-trans,poly-cis-decaprenylcistransferase [Candidatus Diapherotrites archaeon]